jgi:hypothetical protein
LRDFIFLDSTQIKKKKQILKREKKKEIIYLRLTAPTAPELDPTEEAPAAVICF